MTTGAILLRDVDARPAPRTHWGRGASRWDYRWREFLLLHRGAAYSIDLDRCTSSAEMLDWIVQLHRKRWVTDATIANLVAAFNDLFRPQQTLCSCGRERGPIDPRAVAEANGFRVRPCGGRQ